MENQSPTPEGTVPPEIAGLQSILERQITRNIDGYALLFGVRATVEFLSRLTAEYQASRDRIPAAQPDHGIMTLEDALNDPQGFVDGMQETTGRGSTCQHCGTIITETPLGWLHTHGTPHHAPPHRAEPAPS